MIKSKLLDLASILLPREMLFCELEVLLNSWKFIVQISIKRKHKLIGYKSMSIYRERTKRPIPKMKDNLQKTRLFTIPVEPPIMRNS